MQGVAPMLAALVWLAGTLQVPAVEPPGNPVTATNRPPLALLFHQDAGIRAQTVQALGATGDRELIDDLIRAFAVESFTPVLNAYEQALRALTGERRTRGRGPWKAWLAREVAAGRLKLGYAPLETAAAGAALTNAFQPLALALGPEHFRRMTVALTDRNARLDEREAALRYLVANDHRAEVQDLLGGDWLRAWLETEDLGDAGRNALAFRIEALAKPGPLRERIDGQLARCLDSTNATLVTQTLRLLAGAEGYSTRLAVPAAAGGVRRLAEGADAAVAALARKALDIADPAAAAARVSYEEAFADLHRVLGGEYPCFALKGIDWAAVGAELLPRVRSVKTDDQFGLLCLELVARLEDSHAVLGKASRELPVPPFPRWDPGFACLIGDEDRPVVYYVDRGGPAEKAGVRVGMTVLALNGVPAAEVLERTMRQAAQYAGYSSRRYLRYHAAQWLGRQNERDALVTLELQWTNGQTSKVEAPASLGVRYLPRLPAPIPGICDAGDVSWTRLEPDLGYLYVRRIGAGLPEKLDRATSELQDVRGLIVDVRGNSGGGFDAPRAHRNFALGDPEEPGRPRFRGPIALLIDSRCISAGEGWASWFLARGRARVFGEATAGASSRKRTYTLKNGFFTVTYPVKAYTGFLDRPIERRGLEPDVEIRANARDLAAGRDTVLEAAKAYLRRP